MILIIGLGNPGKKYEKTRHNVGFRAVTAFQTKNGFSDFKFSKKFKAEISKGILDSKKIILAKPQTFMNNSGQAVKSLNSKFKIQNSKLFIIHDDLDLPLGKIKISAGHGAAGHKGVESIIRELKTKDFVRFRIGINRFAQNQKLAPYRTEGSGAGSKIPEAISSGCYGAGKIQNLENFVLKKFGKNEEKIIKEVIEKTVEAIETAIEEGIEKTMSKYNQ